MHTVFPRSNTTLVKWPPLNYGHTSRRAEWNKCHPCLVVVAIYSNSTWTTSWQVWPWLFYCECEELRKIVSWELSSKVWHFLRHGGRVTCEVTGRRKCGNRLELPLHTTLCKAMAYKRSRSFKVCFYPTQWPTFISRTKTLQLAFLRAVIFAKISAECNKHCP